MCSKGACRQLSDPRCTWASPWSFHYTLEGQLSEAMAGKAPPNGQSLSQELWLGSPSSAFACSQKRCQSSSFCPDELLFPHAFLFVWSWAARDGALFSGIVLGCKFWSGLWGLDPCQTCRRQTIPACQVLSGEKWPTGRHTLSRRDGNCGLYGACTGEVVLSACLFSCWWDWSWSCLLVSGWLCLTFLWRLPTLVGSS